MGNRCYPLEDETETVTDTARFDAWGNTRSSTGGTPTVHGYKGEVGLQREPHIDPEYETWRAHERIEDAVGRWLSRDPAEADLNDYRPNRNNPVNEVDPSGLQNVTLDDLRHRTPRDIYDAIAGLPEPQLRSLESVLQEKWMPRDVATTVSHLHDVAKGSIEVSTSDALDMIRATSLLRRYTLLADIEEVRFGVFSVASAPGGATRISLTPSRARSENLEDLRFQIGFVFESTSERDLQSFIDSEQLFRTNVLDGIAWARTESRVRAGATVAGIFFEPIAIANAAAAVAENPKDPTALAGAALSLAGPLSVGAKPTTSGAMRAASSADDVAAGGKLVKPSAKPQTLVSPPTAITPTPSGMAGGKANLAPGSGTDITAAPVSNIGVSLQSPVSSTAWTSVTAFKAGTKLDLAGTSVAFSKNTYAKAIGYVYILKDKTTGEVYKVGKTSGGVNIYERFNKYRRKSQEYGYKIEAEFWEAGTEREALDLEGQIRRELKGEGHRLSWDKIANPGRDDFGLPWERSAETRFRIAE